MQRLRELSHPTHLESISHLQRQGFRLLAPVATVAAILALVFQRDSVDSLDKVALPLIAALVLMMELGLRRNWLKLGQALDATYLVISLYLVILFYHQFSSFVPEHQMLSEGVMWFPALSMMAFVLWRVKTASQIVIGTLLITLLIAAFQVAALWQAGQLSDRLLASLSQFFLSNILIVLIQYVVARVRQQYEEMRRLAYLDSLTGLPNRRAAQRLLDHLDGAQQPYALISFDLDHFKLINDQYGHAEGDRVLVQAGQLAGQYLSEPSLLARWGGEEFLMILPGLSSAEACLMAERARSNLAGYSFRFGQVTASFGVVGPINTPPAAQVELLGFADRALQAAKISGRNKVEVASHWHEALLAQYHVHPQETSLR
ncbi:diguanylate cyclase [Deinococcus psychrotolerans]|uniref:Diguanylate cyclase n=1 Tax=Deinococcus psychrotolerans TaxID=2489213 RepID=A0A3G8YGU2_9DEIO|nr:diguanylate cyclase [Deinococcus psychrotolerans]AZI41774.1 diguanylate cyclase [Deinococcus psychrotolerans]